MLTRFSVVGAALMLAAGMVATASADLIAVTDAGSVYKVDESTGAATLLGTNSSSRFMSITRNSAGTYYAGDYGASFSLTSLTTINPTTGLKGADIVPDGNNYLDGLAFSPTDVLYGALDKSGADAIFTVNTTTGVRTLVGTPAGQTIISDIAFVGSTLYGWTTSQGLIQINTSTAASVDVNTSVGNTPAITGLTYNNGVLYGVTGSSLYSISTATGSATLIGAATINGNYQGVAPIPATPEPASLLLLVPGFALFIRRRRTA